MWYRNAFYKSFEVFPVKICQGKIIHIKFQMVFVSFDRRYVINIHLSFVQAVIILID
jgi:hypothetical protein